MIKRVCVYVRLGDFTVQQKLTDNNKKDVTIWENRGMTDSEVPSCHPVLPSFNCPLACRTPSSWSLPLPLLLFLLSLTLLAHLF